MTTLEKILFFWVFLFATPKLIFVPMFRAMWRAMADTDRQQEADEVWLAAYERRQRGDDGLVRRQGRRRRPVPTRPRRPGGGIGPTRHGAMAARPRHGARRPVRAVAR